jgi:prepilin-type N-terminal cleavage/methylation domain-containing protein
MNAQERTGVRRWRQAGRRGFTLIELLVVILIILLVSAVVLPTVIPAINHRQVSEAARILQGALAGARDTAINTNSPLASASFPTRSSTGSTRPLPPSTPPESWPRTATFRSSSRRIIRKARLA